MTEGIGKYLSIWSPNNSHHQLDTGRCRVAVHNDYGVGFHQCGRKATFRVEGLGLCKSHAKKLPLDLLPPELWTQKEVGGWKQGMTAYRACWDSFALKPSVDTAVIQSADKVLTLDSRERAWEYKEKVSPEDCHRTPGEALKAFRETLDTEIRCLLAKKKELEDKVAVVDQLLQESE